MDINSHNNQQDPTLYHLFHRSFNMRHATFRTFQLYGLFPRGHCPTLNYWWLRRISGNDIKGDTYNNKFQVPAVVKSDLDIGFFKFHIDQSFSDRTARAIYPNTANWTATEEPLPTHNTETSKFIENNDMYKEIMFQLNAAEDIIAFQVTCRTTRSVFEGNRHPLDCEDGICHS